MAASKPASPKLKKAALSLARLPAARVELTNKASQIRRHGLALAGLVFTL
ncbi:MAG: hypothetical protein LBR11_03900 [Deltaproteobacteria bacterium]|nr:hypothetical protein [Deltaproteobacteria bacterium]